MNIESMKDELDATLSNYSQHLFGLGSPNPHDT